MKTTYLDYYKMILDKVSFDHNLFRKEYQKALRTLHAQEVSELNHWLQSKGLLSASHSAYADPVAHAA
jgi:hypothetical protein